MGEEVVPVEEEGVVMVLVVRGVECCFILFSY